VVNLTWNHCFQQSTWAKWTVRVYELYGRMVLRDTGTDQRN